MDLSIGAVGISLFQKPAMLHVSPGGYVNGRWQEAPAALPIQAVIQAATQTDLLQLANADRLDGYVRIYTHHPLETVNEDREADAQRIVTPEGVTYRIVKAGRRSEADFTRAIGRLENDRGRTV